MRLLVLGGTVFLSRAVAACALARGHEVVCAARGVSGSIPDGARLVVWDRADPVPDALTTTSFDAVVDVSRTPSHVRSAVAAFPEAHWLFVSTINVYADEETPGQRPGPDAPLRDPLHEDADPAEDPEAYGAMKVACEQTVLDGAATATVIRPGLIVGPGDPSGRFSYWPRRLAGSRDGEPVLAPGDPDDPMQVVDVRDLAAWIVRCAEERLPGVYDGVGPTLPMGELLAQVATGVGADPTLVWVPQDALEAAGVQPWAGPDSVPLWLPRPDYDGLRAHDPGPAHDAGLVVRPLAETARDTLAWLDADPDAPVVAGIDRDREREVLAGRTAT